LEKLVSTNEASKLLGISVQGVHYRIKKGQLKSLKKDGKTFVYINDKTTTNNKTTISSNQTILDAKDEQIKLLKETMSWMKKQYKQEIKRLNKNQLKIIDVFKSEITLLQQAYNEIKELHKLPQPKYSTEILTIKDFFMIMKKYNKTNNQIKKIILQRIKLNDYRFNYDPFTKNLTIYKDDFSDLI